MNRSAGVKSVVLSRLICFRVCLLRISMRARKYPAAQRRKTWSTAYKNKRNKKQPRLARLGHKKDSGIPR